MFTIIAAGVAAVATVVGALIANGQEAEARELMREAARQYGMPLPELETVIAEQIGPSAMEGVQADSQSVAAQRAALERLAGLAEGGPDAQYDAAMMGAMSDAGSFASRQMAGARDALAARGTLGGGQEAVMTAVGAQQGANRAARSAQDAAADRQRRAYEALRDSGSMATQMRSQQFGEDARRAEARDAIERQNAMFRTQAAGQNNTNRMAVWDRQFDQARGRANALTQQATQGRQDAQNTRDEWAGYSQAAGRAGQAADAYGQPAAPPSGAQQQDEDWKRFNR